MGQVDTPLPMSQGWPHEVVCGYLHGGALLSVMSRGADHSKAILHAPQSGKERGERKKI